MTAPVTVNSVRRPTVNGAPAAIIWACPEWAERLMTAELEADNARITDALALAQEDNGVLKLKLVHASNALARARARRKGKGKA